MAHIYCISGFGADERIFKYLDFGDNVVHHLPWFNPEKNDSIESYAARMAEGIHQDEPILLGLSFGGMMAGEIAKQKKVQKLILISTIKTKAEKPFYFKAAAALRLNEWIPLKPYSFLEPLENYNLGAITEEEKLLVREYRQRLDNNYSDWAIDRILHWGNERDPENFIHIHGTNDHIFPVKYVNPTHRIKGGGHFMLMNKAEEINAILKQNL